MELHLDAFAVAVGGARRFLHTSPEYALKKLLGQGADRIYAIVPCFRDEPPSRTHNPEFTMLEWYSVGTDLFGLMDQTEVVIRAAAGAIGLDAVQVDGETLDLSRPFERRTVRAAFVDLAGVDPWRHSTANGLRSAARAKGLSVPTESPAWDDVFFQIFLDAVEPRLGRGRPTFLWGWPASQAALSRLDPADPTTALRFELFAGGLELANAFDELIDPVEQRSRFEAEAVQRAALGKPVYPIDEALLEALSRMMPTAGIALGVDRLVMLLTGVEHIGGVRLGAR
jgi:lysyl-tRNA synthetase class 2